MELNKALKIVLELAEQNMLNDPDMPLEMKEQFDAIESVRMHLQELENPSPIQAMLFIHGGVIHESISNVPLVITTLDEDIVGRVPIECNPQRVATIHSEINNQL